MMDARYIKAVTVLPKQNKVCGRTLLPFCLRHRVVLEGIGSPLLDKDYNKVTPLDIITAVKILSTYSKEEMDARLTLMDKFYLLQLYFSKKKFTYAFGTILGVMMTSCSYPKLWAKNNKSTSNVPMALSCVTSLIRNGCSYEEAWTMPEGEAIWMTIANSIYDGAKIDILTTQDEEHLEKFDEIIENYKNRMNIK